MTGSESTRTSNGLIPLTPIGAGLRHEHYEVVLDSEQPLPSSLNFVEVHAENFFPAGGAARSMLREVSKRLPVSIHGTAMGLGSVAGVPESHIKQFVNLVEDINPFLVSEHAAFTWGVAGHQPQVVHGGDLLPFAFNEQMLTVLTENIDSVQNRLQRQLLIENLSAYLTPAGQTLSEPEFFTSLIDRTGCRLLLDLNNLAVNVWNHQALHGQHPEQPLSDTETLQHIVQYLNALPRNAVGEIHLAGCTPVEPGDIMTDDHGRKVSNVVWRAYDLALERFGPTPTLIEWDTQLPEWETLVAETQKARDIADTRFQTVHRQDSVPELAL